jgi:hypothetical protein
MKTLTVLVLLVAVASACFAQQFSFGTFNSEGYNAEYVSTQVKIGEKPVNIYVEHEPDLDYTLGIVSCPLSAEVSAVARVESPNWLRLGLKAQVGGGTSRFTVLALPGRGDAPSWFDIFTPAVPVVKNVTLDGWFRFREDGKPILWVGPSVKLGHHCVWVRTDLNGGPWAGGIDF